MTPSPPPKWRIKRPGEDLYHWWDGPLECVGWLVMVGLACVVLKLSEQEPIVLAGVVSFVSLLFGVAIGYQMGRRR